MSVKQIADETKLPERTVARVFSGDTDNPFVNTLHRIVTVPGGFLGAGNNPMVGMTVSVAVAVEEASK